jgi:hypothetical protein
MASSMTVVDVAGAQMGGAAKFLGELRAYLARHPRPELRLIGLDRGLTPQWLVQRERMARGANRRIALNNVGFLTGRGNCTLLRNALHFSSDEELRALNFRPSRELRLQTHIVRAAARRSTMLVVPCQAMAERVTRHAPGLAPRLVVRPHPVSPAPWSGNRSVGETSILLPVLNAPYKRLGDHVSGLLRALDESGLDGRLVVTAMEHEFAPQIAADTRVRFTGPLPGERLDQEWQKATAIYFPTQLESFGYPLAEARANGMPVIALDTDQNREIAGPALRPFSQGDRSSLAEAVGAALTVPAAADPAPFDPDRYFEWLLGEQP